MRDLKVGVSIPTGPYPNIHVAAKVDALGFDSIWVGDHPAIDRYEFDAMVVLSCYAAVTKQATVGVAVLVLPLRHPVLLAKTCASLDRISDGRFMLGVGAGGDFPEQFRACGADSSKRGAVTDESIEVLRLLWTRDRVDYSGKHFHLEGVTVQPRPVRAEGIPIWVGGRSEGAVRRTARFGDGYIPFYTTPARYRESWEKVQTYAQTFGRDASLIEPAIVTWLALARSSEDALRMGRRYRLETYGVPMGDSDEEFERLMEKYYNVGTPDHCLKRISEYVDAGVRHLVFRPTCPSEETAEQIQMIAEQIVPEVRRWSPKA